MKKLLSWLLILVMCVSLIGCSEKKEAKSETIAETVATTQATEPVPTVETTPEPTETTPKPTELTETTGSTPLLYKVTDENGNVAWLFGSIHVGREDYYPLPEYVMDAYNSADSLAVEFDVIAFQENPQAAAGLASKMMYLDGSTIADHIPQDLYDRAKAAMEGLDMYMSMYDYFIPIAWQSDLQNGLIASWGLDTELGIDMHMLRLAKEEGKEILDVESAEFQFEMMCNFSEELQVKLLEEMVLGCENQEEYKAELEIMMDLWASGDEAAFEAYLLEDASEISPDEAELYEEYDQAMTVSRNLNMTEYAEDALASGKEVFICVGAAHVVGEGAMAQLLAERGYTVELITQ